MLKFKNPYWFTIERMLTRFNLSNYKEIKHQSDMKKHLVFLFISISFQLQAQEIQKRIKFNSISRPEKLWIIAHPLASFKTYKYTLICLNEVEKIKNKNTIGSDETGGKLDAFKHALWMALLAQKTSPKKALKLGLAHEKGNYLDFKKKKKEENMCADKASSEMDMWNNEVGIKIGSQNMHSDINALINAILNALEKGELKLIKKDARGNFLDQNNNIIEQSTFCDSWENSKCLIYSNMSY
jgi:hypothetical protein